MIFLTGGTGLLGLHTIKALIAGGEPVLGLARSADAAATLRELGARPVMGRVEDGATWKQVEHCKAIIHSAALVYASGDWNDYQQVNVEATRLAAQRARVLGVPLIHISSVAVYGDAAYAKGGEIDEQAATGSLTDGLPYPRSKRLAEQAVWEECGKGLQAIALRPCVVYGEGDRLFLPNLVRRALRGWFPQIGDGQRSLALVYAGNVAQGVLAALRANEGWGRAYNLTNDDPITGAELIAQLSEGIGRPVRAEAVPRWLAGAVAGTIDFATSFKRSPLPKLRAAVRFLGNGNPYTSAAARQILGWNPADPHRVALPRSVRTILER